MVPGRTLWGSLEKTIYSTKAFNITEAITYNQASRFREAERRQNGPSIPKVYQRGTEKDLWEQEVWRIWQEQKKGITNPGKPGLCRVKRVRYKKIQHRGYKAVSGNAYCRMRIVFEDSQMTIDDFMKEGKQNGKIIYQGKYRDAFWPGYLLHISGSSQKAT